jgi:paraquat-inducible protein B
MSKKVNPTLIGAFVVGAIILLSLAIILFGGETIFTQRERVVMFFSGSVDGLDVGSPVTVRGVEIGTVTAINLQFNTETGDLKIPVIAEINAASIDQVRQLKVEDPLTAIIENLGLRAQLKIQSILTSQLFIELDYHPGTEINYYGDGTMLEIPTIPMPIEQLEKVFNEISLEKLITDVTSAISAINNLVNSPELMQTIINMKDAFANVETLSKELKKEIQELGTNTNQTMAELRQTVQDLKPALDTALQELARAAKTVSELQDLPQMQRLDTALSEISEAASTIRNLEDTPQMMNLNTAMEELASAARAVRILADAIERQPEILLRGKKDPK